MEFVWYSLAAAIAAILLGSKVWLALFPLVLVLALLFDVLTFTGLAFIGFAGLLLLGIARTKHKPLAFFLEGILLLLLVALVVHQVPGFNNQLVVDAQRLGADAVPYSLYFNFDKPLLVFALVLLLPQMLKPGVSLSDRRWPLLACALLSALPFIAMPFGLLTFDVKLAAWWPCFVLANLFFTCAAEEVFFRGYLLARLKFLGWPLALLISSVLFALVHIKAGWAYVLLAGLAGLAYGLIYLFSQRLWLAVVAHFGFNFYHFVFFTYPLLARG